jgi:hypothetical protein
VAAEKAHIDYGEHKLSEVAELCVALTAAAGAALSKAEALGAAARAMQIANGEDKLACMATRLCLSTDKYCRGFKAIKHVFKRQGREVTEEEVTELEGLLNVVPPKMSKKELKEFRKGQKLKECLANVVVPSVGLLIEPSFGPSSLANLSCLQLERAMEIEAAGRGQCLLQEGLSSSSAALNEGNFGFGIVSSGLELERGLSALEWATERDLQARTAEVLARFPSAAVDVVWHVSILTHTTELFFGASEGSSSYLVQV